MSRPNPLSGESGGPARDEQLRGADLYARQTEALLTDLRVAAVAKALYKADGSLRLAVLLERASALLKKQEKTQLTFEEMKVSLATLRELQLIYVDEGSATLTATGSDLASILSRRTGTNRSVTD